MSYKPGPGELLIEDEDGQVYRIGEIPKEYRDRAKKYHPNEIVIPTEDDKDDKAEDRKPNWSLPKFPKR
jgi:hypothetical protein